MHLAQELLMNLQCSSGSGSFAKLMKVLKGRSIVAGHWKFTTTNWKPASKLIPVLKGRSIVGSHWKFTTTNWKPASKLILFQLYEKLPKNSTFTILQLFSIWKMVKVKKLGKWVSQELTTNQKKKKIIIWRCCLLLFCATMNHFSIGLWHVMKSGFYATTGDDQLSG